MPSLPSFPHGVSSIATQHYNKRTPPYSRIARPSIGYAGSDSTVIYCVHSYLQYVPKYIPKYVGRYIVCTDGSVLDGVYVVS